MDRINWQNYPWLTKRILELDSEELPAGDIAEILLDNFPTYFVTKPTEDSVRSAIRRAKESQENIASIPEIAAEEEVDPHLGDFIGLRTLYVDIESTNLGALWGHMLCCSFADEWGNVETLRIDQPEFAGKNIIDDSKLAAAVRDKIESADVVVGHNFKLFDKPFVNSRLIKAHERPISLSQKILDSLYLVGGQNMRLGSRRLDSVAQFLNLPVQKTALEGETWQLAGAGDRDALDKVVEHCEHDVLVERLAFSRIKGFVSVIHR